MSDLILIEKLDPKVIFTDDEADKIINQITEKVKEFELSVDTAKSRKEISTLAAKVSKSKVLIDELGKNLVAGWKADAKKVDVVRKKIRDSLDELRDSTRAPLNEWEEIEKKRVADHEHNINEMVKARDSASEWLTTDLKVMEDRLLAIQAVVLDEAWEEFQHDATVVKFEAITALEKAIEQRKAQDAKDAELEKYRLQAAEDDRKHFEHQQQLEADERARQKTIEENTRLEEEKKAAEKRAQEAEEKAFRELEEKQAKEKAEADARAADKKHRGQINKKALDAFVVAGLDKETSKNVVTLIAKGMIPNVTINY